MAIATDIADAPPVPTLAGVRELAPRYDGFILDLWGVIHDGLAPYPGAADALRRLSGEGKRVLLLSNAPRRAGAITAQLDRFGIGAGCYDHVLTSGEATHRALLHRDDPAVAGLGRACFHMGPDRDRRLLEGLDLARVDRVEDADFILATGFDWHEESTEPYEPDLLRGARRGVPMICANPDLEVIRGGRRILCAGTLAARYEALGGTVVYFGKPFRPIYERAFRLLDGVERDRIVAIGDSLRTDIAGAERAGIDGVLCTGGLHAEELGIRPGDAPPPAALARICARAGVRPVAALPALVW